MNLVSTIIGLVSLLLGLIGFFPLLDWMNWLALFLAILGMTLGLYSKDRTSGITINFLVIIFAILRLYVGGGIV